MATKTEIRNLSPSRAGDFKRCGLRFRFKNIDKIEEPPTLQSMTGNLVHATLEVLMQHDPDRRTHKEAQGILASLFMHKDREWSDIGQFGVEASAEALSNAQRFVSTYFAIEDPRTVEAQRLEWRVAHWIDGVEFRGVIDRVDADNTLVDYKTGRVPGENFEQSAFFGLRFYAWVCWKQYRFMPPRMRLLYLETGEVLELQPDERMLMAFERQLLAIVAAIRRAQDRDDFRPRPSGLCKVCSYVSRCPVWEGVPLPWAKEDAR